MRTPEMRTRIVRAQFDRLFDFVFGRIPIPIKRESDPSQGDIRLSKVGINFQRVPGSRLCLGISFL